MRKKTLITLVAAGVLLLATAGGAGAAMPTVAAGASHSCGLADSGAVYCWGDNSFGQLGNGNTAASPSPVQVVGLPRAAAALAAGRDSTCALLDDRSIWCWGANGAGQLGRGTVDLPTPAAHVTPEPVVGVGNAARISATDRTYCYVAYDQLVRCWGENDNGEIGSVSATSPQVTPIRVDGLSNARAVSVGFKHVCAMLNDGTARCWGDNSNGVLGDGTTTPSNTPVPVAGISVGATIYAGGTSTCATVGTGQAKCWGAAGLLGDGSGQASLAPRDVSSIAGAPMLGGSAITNCAVNGGQTLACWGSNPGNGSAQTAFSPVVVPTSPGVLAVTGNGLAGHVCTVVRGGEVDCWGESNAAGQMGNGSVSPAAQLAPARVANLDLVTGVYTSTQISFKSRGKAKIDRKRRNYSQKFELAAALPMLIGPADGCTGRASASAAYSYRKVKKVKGKKRKVKVTKTYKAKASFKYDGVGCSAKLTLKLPVKHFNGKKVRVKGAWPGNSSIAPINVTSAKVKLSKVKARRR